MQLSFTAKKTREGTPDSPAYATFVGGDWTYEVLKSWQNDEAKPYARWLCRVVTPMTGPSGDMGDTYVRDVVLHAWLTEVDGRPATRAEQLEVVELRSELLGVTV
jgi:hypothetical protein